MPKGCHIVVNSYVLAVGISWGMSCYDGSPLLPLLPTPAPPLAMACCTQPINSISSSINCANVIDLKRLWGSFCKQGWPAGWWEGGGTGAWAGMWKIVAGVDFAAAVVEFSFALRVEDKCVSAGPIRTSGTNQPPPP